MTIVEDIFNLPDETYEGQPGHLEFHNVLHQGIKAHQLALQTLDGRTSAGVSDSTFGNVHTGLTYLAGELSNKPSFAEVNTSLAGKANTSHTHSISNITNLQTTLDSKAGLVGGVIPTSLLPRVNIGETYPVANASARLALDAQAGDVAIQNDTDTLWMLKKTPATTAGNWMDLTAIGASSGVISVNGQTGTVVLAAADVSAVPTSRTVTSGTGMTGGGDLTANRSLGLNSASQASLAKADSAVQGFVNGTATGTKVERMTAAQYAALGSKDSNTVYLVAG